MLGAVIFALFGIGLLANAHKQVRTGWLIGPVEGWAPPRQARPFWFWFWVIQGAFMGLGMSVFAIVLTLSAVGAPILERNAG